MSDRMFFAAAFLVAAAVIALAIVWPQGYGRRSPGVFGGPVQITDASRRDLAKERAKAMPKQPSSPAAAGPRP
jgi:hypothetical protein